MCTDSKYSEQGLNLLSEYTSWTTSWNLVDWVGSDCSAIQVEETEGWYYSYELSTTRIILAVFLGHSLIVAIVHDR